MNEHMKPTPDEMAAAAEALAARIAARTTKAYAASVRKYAEHYDELPNADDFLTGLEGYDWWASLTEGSTE